MERIKSRLWGRPQQPQPEDNIMDTTPPYNVEGIDPLELANEENARLQNTIADLTNQLQALQESQLSLQSKNDDFDQKLQLEQRKLKWQKHFYEKKIVEMAVGLTNGNGTSVDPQVIINSLSDSFYHETIFDLVAEQERKDGQLKQMESTFQNEIRSLKEVHDAAVSDMVESNFLQVQKLTQEHENLIRDLLNGCEQGLFKEMKEEYLVDAENNVEFRATNGNKIWAQFQRMPSNKKGVIVVAVCVITVGTAGFASWGFITWIWPQLVIFAEYVATNPHVWRTWATFLVEFLNSVQFQSFIMAWEQGQTLASCLKPFLNTAILVSALQMSPNLISQLKNRRSVKV